MTLFRSPFFQRAGGGEEALQPGGDSADDAGLGAPIAALPQRERAGARPTGGEQGCDAARTVLVAAGDRHVQREIPRASKELWIHCERSRKQGRLHLFYTADGMCLRFINTRSCLLPDRAESLVFLNKNIELY